MGEARGVEPVVPVEECDQVKRRARRPARIEEGVAAVGRDRADLVLAGCAILEAIRRAFPSERLRIADRGLREGLLMNMMREDGVWNRKAVR